MDRSKGKENFNSIVKLGKQFLPSFNEFLAASTNTASYAVSVVSVPGHRGDEKDTYRYYWEASFDLRIGNTSVHIHNTHHNDHGLILFEKKLCLLKFEIEQFMSQSKFRSDNPDKDRKKEVRRIWLNDEDTLNLATGYIGSRLSKSGCGQLFIADCHRTINLHLGHQRMVKKLSKLVDSINRTISALIETRETFDNLAKL